MYGLSCKEYVIITDNNCTETNLYLWHVTQATSTYLSRVLKTIVCKIITVQKSERTHSCFLCSGIQCKNHLLMRLLCIEYNKYYALDTYGTVWTNLCNSPNIHSSRSLMCANWWSFTSVYWHCRQNTSCRSSDSVSLPPFQMATCGIWTWRMTVGRRGKDLLQQVKRTARCHWAVATLWKCLLGNWVRQQPSCWAN